MIDDDESFARELLGAARSLLDRASDDTQGLWPRAAAFCRARPRALPSSAQPSKGQPWKFCCSCW